MLPFIILWTPYYFCVLWAIVDQNSFNRHVNQKLKNYLFAFSLLNSCVSNPLLYGKHLTILFCCCFFFCKIWLNSIQNISFWKGIYSNKLYEFCPGMRNNKNFRSNSYSVKLSVRKSLIRQNSAFRICEQKFTPTTNNNRGCSFRESNL